MIWVIGQTKRGWTTLKGNFVLAVENLDLPEDFDFTKLFNLPEYLVRIIQQINGDPFSRLIEVCAPVTMSLVSKYFIVGYEPDDIMQEARWALLKSAKTFKKEEGMEFLRYYHMTLTNHLNMLVRSEHANKRKVNLLANSLDEIMEGAGEYIQGSSCILTHPENAIIAKECFEEYLSDLSPFERKVFKRIIDGFSLAQIAVQMNSTKTQVKNAWYRCGIKYKKKII